MLTLRSKSSPVGNIFQTTRVILPPSRAAPSEMTGAAIAVSNARMHDVTWAMRYLLFADVGEGGFLAGFPGRTH